MEKRKSSLKMEKKKSSKKSSISIRSPYEFPADDEEY